MLLCGGDGSFFQHVESDARVEPLREPLVNRSKQFARLLRLALVAPEAGEPIASGYLLEVCGAYYKRPLIIPTGHPTTLPLVYQEHRPPSAD